MVKPTVSLNSVAEDLVWKDHVSKELRSAKQWPENWSFLIAFGKQKKENVKTKTGLSKKSTNLKLPPIHNEHKAERKYEPFPQTTSGLIGWKSSDPHNNVDCYGPYTTPVKSFLTQMKWPAEAML